ncbi:MAG TPA: hypothetical protein PLJ35_09055 [Anaerolineae bacterium]|nr:hypothetical protein [Anaerolineae bacterium]HOQ98957.1 hypothetical protein [Anaerolineae bacterium]HPL27603.1 hypothetical protein [Anaerolineae bacterium]
MKRNALLVLAVVIAVLTACSRPFEPTQSPATPASTASPSPAPGRERTRARVEMDVFDDRPDPTWELSPEQTDQVIAAMFSGGSPAAGEPSRCPSASGYRGFVVTWIGDARYLSGGPESLRVCGGRIEARGRIGAKAPGPAEPEIVQDLDHRLEYYLLETARPHVDAALYDAVRQEIARRTAPDDATPYARLRIARYALAGELPADLPTEAPVYSVVPGTVPDEEWARRVAAALGFAGDPSGESRSAAQPAWTWLGPERNSLLDVYGGIAYTCARPPAQARPANAPETADQAIAAVRAWLTAQGLLPADCADDAQAWPGVDGLGWEVRFRRRLDGRPVGSDWTMTGGLLVRLNSLGEVDSLGYLRHEVEKGAPVPLKPLQQAWQELQTYGPTHFDLEGAATGPAYEAFTVTHVGLGYRECCYGSAEVQEALRPYYVFTGEVEIANWPRRIRASAYVPAGAAP